MRVSLQFSAMKYHIKTFGCQMNYADSEKIDALLMGSGGFKVLDPTLADLVILNTCSVRQKAEDRVWGYVREVRKAAKVSGKDVRIGITGCMVRKTGLQDVYYDRDRNRHKAAKITRLDYTDSSSIFNSDDGILITSKSVDFVFRIEEVGALPKILSLVYGREIGNDAKIEEYLHMRQTRDNSSSANVIIQTGCDNYCSFCIVPTTRGREVSRPHSEIISEAQSAVQSGAKEITLLGQNVNSYGKETKKKLWNSDALTWNDSELLEKTPFRELLDSLSQIEGLDRIRFTSSNPHDMTRDILDAHFDCPACCHYLHFALQSGSDSMLKRMNRKHTYADFKAQLNYLR